MHTLETLRTFKTKNFIVVARAVEDCDIDLSWDDTGEVAEKLNSGEYVGFGVIVKVYYKGLEIGEDSLWGNIYSSYSEFMDHKECGKQNREYEAKGEKGRCGSYFHDMIRQSIKDARKTLTEMRDAKVRVN